MSKKIIKIAALVVAVAAAIPTGGGSLLAVGLGVSSGVASLIAVGVSVGASLLTKPKTPKIGTANEDRLNVSINVRAPRVMAFGKTALATDLRDQEFTGTGKEYLHRFIVNAAHRISAHSEIWFDDQLAWTAAGGVQAPYTGYLTVTPIAEGAPGNAINIGPRMGSSRRFTGCAYVHLRFKLTGNSKKTESPFAQQVPTRMTIVGEGAPCYDVRQDSTRGGTGAHRADDQSTWTWGTHARNPACQLATWLLGWRIQNPQSLTWKLSVGAGIPPDRIDWASFLEAANLCDEPVTLSGAGTEPRYRCDGLVDEDDGPSAIVDAFKASMNADLDDQDGLLRLTVFHNDLASPDADFTEADIQGDFVWLQTPPLNDSYNVVRGNYVEPAALFQPTPYRDAAIASPDGLERLHPADFGLVQSRSQAERLAKQRLQRQQYGGEFRATFLASGWKVQKNSVVRLSFAPEGWVNKLFRVAETEVRQDGLVPMVLREEHAQIYAWDAEESPAVQIAAPTLYLPGDAPIPQFLGTVEEGATVGAVLGDNLREEGGVAVLPPGEVRNETINLSADGTLTYDPGTGPVALGAVTPAGIGAFRSFLTSSAFMLNAYAAGGAVDYSPATGQFKVFSGATDVSASFALSTQSNPQALTIGYAGQTFSVTAGFDEDNASAVIRATGSGAYAGVVFDQTITLTKLKGGFEIVSALPGTNLFEGRTVYLDTDGKLYRYHSGAWTSGITASDIPAGAIDSAKMAAGLEVPGTFTGSLPSVKTTNLLVNAATGQSYTWDSVGGLYRPLVDSADNIPAAQISGQLTDAQIADLAATKVTGQLTDAQIAALSAAKLTGKITTVQINDDAITTPLLAAGAVTAAEIAAGAVVAEKLSVAAVTDNLVVNGRAEEGTSGWTPLGTGTFGYGNSGWGITGFTYFYLTKPTEADALRADSRAFRTIAGKKYSVKFRLSGSSATAGSLYVRIFAGDSSATSSMTFASYIDLLANAPVPTDSTGKQYEFTFTATNTWACLDIYNYVGGPLSLYFHDVEIRELVDGVRIQDGVVTAAKVAAGAITADKIAANSVYASKVVVGDPSNMIADAQWDDTAGWWTVNGANMPVAGGWGIVPNAPAYGFGGKAFLHIGANAATQPVTTQYIPVRPGDSYHVSLTVNPNGMPTTAYLYWADANYTHVQSTNIIANVTGGLTTYTLNATAPAGAAFVRLQVIREAGGVNGIYVGDLVLRKAASGELIVDGAITAAKVAANAITAGKVSAGAITAAAIAANAIQTQHLSVTTQTDNLVTNPLGREGPNGGTPLGWQAFQGGAPTSFYQHDDMFAAGRSGFALGKALTSDGTSVINRKFRVIPGRVYTLRGYFSANSSTGSGVYLRLIFNANNPAEDYVTAVNEQLIDVLSSGQPSGLVEYTFTAPASMNWCSFAIYSWVGAPTALYWTDLEIREQKKSVHIGDGAVTANQIAAGAVTAAKISVTDLSAINANMGTITAGTIQGASGNHVYTVSTGVRRTVLGSYRFMDGPGFGASSNLIMWFGANTVTLGTESVANSIWAMANDGKVYYGTTEIANGGINAIWERDCSHSSPTFGGSTQSGKVVFVPDVSTAYIRVDCSAEHDGVGGTATGSFQVEYSADGSTGWTSVGSPITVSVNATTLTATNSGVVTKTGLTAGAPAYFRVTTTAGGTYGDFVSLTGSFKATL